jgi:hypothetical protein
MDELERFFLHLLNFCIDMFAKKYRPTFSAWAVSFTGWCSVAAPEIRSKSRRSTYSQTTNGDNCCCKRKRLAWKLPGDPMRARNGEKNSEQMDL